MSTYNLMIIESPGKRKKLADILANIRPGEEWRIEASVGHVRDLPATGQGPDEITTGVRKDFLPIYELTERGREIVGKLKSLAAKANIVYLATDPDREGESIAWHLRESIGLKNPVRIAFNEITESKVEQAFQNQGVVKMRLVMAQEARRVIDRLVGYQVSNELRRQHGQNLSAGRVQSVAVMLVVMRERRIAAFRSTTHYGAELLFSGSTAEFGWSVRWLTEAGFVTDDQPYFMDRVYSELVAGVRKVVVQSFEETDALRNPPAPFTTSTLQQAASNSLKWSPTDTMKVAQQLYEQGLISYHRSDNPNVADDAMPEIQAVAQALGLEAVEKRRKFKAKDGAQEGHPGITPTYWEKAVAGDTPEQQALYKLIRVRAIASQLMPARYKVRTVYMEAAAPVGGKAVVFGAKGRALVEAGWLSLLAEDATQDADDDDGSAAEAQNPIPVLRPGQELTATDGKLVEMKTKAPKRYTQASLIAALESEGIGRPATYASIMNNIMSRELIGESKRFLSPQPKGVLVVESLEQKFSFLDLGFTREMENDLDRIAEGQAQYKEVVSRLQETLESELTTQQAQVKTFTKVEVVHNCPDCQRPLRLVKTGTPFWSCTGFPELCKTALPDAGGKPGAKKVVELSDYPCGKCGKPLIHRKKPGKKTGYDFWGCSGYAEGCKTTYPNLKGNKPDMAKGR